MSIFHFMVSNPSFVVLTALEVRSKGSGLIRINDDPTLGPAAIRVIGQELCKMSKPVQIRVKLKSA
jgi:hypothetical protein